MASLPTLDCSVCMNAFSSTERATVPYVYTCGHSCCFSCTEALKNPRQQASYRACPECKEKWATDPRKNFGLIRSLELQATQVRSSVERAPARQTTRSQVQAAASRSATPLTSQQDTPVADPIVLTVRQPGTARLAVVNRTNGSTMDSLIQRIKSNNTVKELFQEYDVDIENIRSLSVQIDHGLRFLFLKDRNNKVLINITPAHYFGNSESARDLREIMTALENGQFPQTSRRSIPTAAPQTSPSTASTNEAITPHEDDELNALVNSLLDESTHRSNHIANTSGKRNARFFEFMKQIQENQAAQQERSDLLMAQFMSTVADQNRNHMQLSMLALLLQPNR